MSVGFGFSCGDIVTALALLGTVIEAVRKGGGAGAELQKLIDELRTLENVLLRVKGVELDASQGRERAALHAAVSQCQRTIREFWTTTVRKYQPHLQASESGWKVKDAWMKVRWAVCEKEDVAKLKADLRSHAVSIELVLMTVQMTSKNLRFRKQDRQDRLLGEKVQSMFVQCLEKMAMLTGAIHCDAQQGKELLESSAKIMQTNLDIFEAIRDFQNHIIEIPAQVERQQPVYMIDALKKDAPFHLEFIRSAEAFLHVLKANLRIVKSGPEKIDRGEFIITVKGSWRQVDLSQDWESCFFPGQRDSLNEDIDCSNCGTTFQKVDVSTQEIEPFSKHKGLGVCRHRLSSTIDNEISHFRRIQIVQATPDKSDAFANLEKTDIPIRDVRENHDSGCTDTPGHKNKRGCIQIVERYAVCGCIYYKHAIEHSPLCTCRGRGQNVTVKDVLVGYACARHCKPALQQSPTSRLNAVSETFSKTERLRDRRRIDDLPTPPSSASQSLEIEANWPLSLSQSRIANLDRNRRPQRVLRKRTGSVYDRSSFPLSPSISGESDITDWRRSLSTSSPAPMRIVESSGNVSSSLPVRIKNITADKSAPPPLPPPRYIEDLVGIR